MFEMGTGVRSEEHTSELQSRQYLVCRLLLCQRFGLRQSRTSVRSFLTPCAFVHKPRNPAQLSRYLVPSKLNNALCVIPETIGQAFDLLVSVS